MKEFKRIFRVFLSVLFLIQLVRPICAFAASPNDDGLVEVTETDAINLAQDFFDEVFPVEVNADTPEKLYKSDGQATGYVVNALRNGSPHGYVIYDFSKNWCISRFSFDEGASFPSTNSRVAFKNLDNTRLVALDSLSFASIDSSGNGMNLGTGEHVYLENAANTWSGIDITTDRSSDPTKFEQVLTNHATLYKQGYTVTSANAISGYSNPTELTVEQYTNRYACAVSSMYTMCSYYLPMGGMSDVNKSYIELWNLSNTQIQKVERGITFGTTNDRNQPKAITEFCSNRGKTVNVTFTPYPSWDQFKNCIDNKQIAQFGATLRSNQSGHAMATVGYMTLKNTRTGGNMQTLMVCDGWYPEIAILPYDITPYVYHSGIFCNG